MIDNKQFNSCYISFEISLLYVCVFTLLYVCLLTVIRVNNYFIGFRNCLNSFVFVESYFIYLLMFLEEDVIFYI